MTRARPRRRRPAEPLDATVCDGRETVGRLIFLGAGWRAEDGAGCSLGVFETRGEAREAIAEHQRGAA